MPEMPLPAPPCGLTECLIHHHGIPPNNASNNNKKSVEPEGSAAMGSSPCNFLVLSCIPSLRNIWLDTMVKFLAEGSAVAVQPESLWYFLQNLVYAFDQ